MSTTTTTLTPEQANALDTEDTARTANWREVTRALRTEKLDEFFEAAKADIIKARTGKVKKENVFNQGQVEKAKTIAQGQLVGFFYNLEEFEGFRNPVWDDEEWSPARKKAEPAHKPNRYGGRCPKCDVWVEAEAGKLVKLPNGKWGAEHLTCPEVSQPEETPSQPVKGLDLTDLPSGYYAVPGGDTRLKVRIAHGKEGTKWDGFTFVTDGAAYGQQKRYGMQRPGQAYSGDIQDALKAITADPKAASQAYGHLVGRCGRCNAVLEDETSIANGIGPICAEKF